MNKRRLFTELWNVKEWAAFGNANYFPQQQIKDSGKEGSLAFRALNFYLPAPKPWQSTGFSNNPMKTIQTYSFTFICLHVSPVLLPEEITYTVGRSINSKVGQPGSESGPSLLVV